MFLTLYTPSGVRLRQHSIRPGPLNWLLLPGGPGLGSQSLEELANALTVPGIIWLVDLPGDGSNRHPPTGTANLFCNWPKVVVEAAQALPNVVFAGHSTGGMYLLSTPELAPYILGLALLDTAPDASWHPRFVAMAGAHPLPSVDRASRLYEAEHCDQHLAAIAVAAADWNFTPAGLAVGRELLRRLPYNRAAVEWSEANFDHVYTAKWWPDSIPVLILAGSDDRVVWQGGWDDARFKTAHVWTKIIPGAGHFPWIENPSAVDVAFNELAERVKNGQVGGGKRDGRNQKMTTLPDHRV
jgi:pimeloyl-ACP methyl ester carboxylesterase